MHPRFSIIVQHDRRSIGDVICARWTIRYRRASIRLLVTWRDIRDANIAIKADDGSLNLRYLESAGRERLALNHRRLDYNDVCHGHPSRDGWIPSTSSANFTNRRSHVMSDFIIFYDRPDRGNDLTRNQRRLCLREDKTLPRGSPAKRERRCHFYSRARCE